MHVCQFTVISIGPQYQKKVNVGVRLSLGGTHTQVKTAISPGLPLTVDGEGLLVFFCDVFTPAGENRVKSSFNL